MVDKLADELVFQDDGHLHEIALAAIADDQDCVVPDTALRHLDACVLCVDRLSEQAWLSASVGDVVRLVGASTATATLPVQTVRFPVVWVLLGTVFAAIGVFGDASSLGTSLRAVPALIFHGGPIAMRTVTGAFASPSGQVLSLWLMIITTLVFAFVGVAIARMPVKQAVPSRSRQGVAI